MNLKLKPFLWVSAHREIKFTFEFDLHYTIQGFFNVGGKLSIQFADDGIHSQSVGDYVWVNTGGYSGYHKITEITTSFIYLTDTDYSGFQAAGNQIYFVEDAVFKIYAGYASGFLSTLLPYQLVATFKPEPNLEGKLVVDISGYVNKLFDVLNSNDTTDYFGFNVFYNLFNQVEIFVDDVFKSRHNVLNASISMFELNRDYIGTGRPLNSGSLGPHYFNCVENLNQIIQGGYVFEGPPLSGAIYPDFSPTYFNATDFDTVV